jgi:hypothetical protein
MDKPSFNFGIALNYIKAGKKVMREGWNGKGMYVSLFESNKSDRLSYLMLKTVDDKFVPWTVSQTDVLAEDWRIYE